MMKHSTPSLSLSGGMLDLYEEDFSLGAKAKSFLQPESSLKHESDPNWLDTYSYLGDTFEPFEEVILPDEDINIDPDKFITDLNLFETPKHDPFTPVGLSANPLGPVIPMEDSPATNVPSDYEDVKIEEFNAFDFIDSSYNPPPSDNKPYAKLEQNNISWNNPVNNSIEYIVQPSTSNEITEPLQVIESQNSVITVPIEEYINSTIPSKPQTIQISLKKVSLPRKIKNNEPKPIIVTPVEPQAVTLKDALNMGYIDEVFGDVMHMEGGKEVKGIGSYLDSDSDESSYIDSPSSSGSSNSSSPCYESYSPTITLDDDSFTIIHQSEIPSKPNTHNRSDIYKSKPKRIDGKIKPSIVDKKLKKKEQNKNAATRYRQKKKHEETIVMEKLMEEEERSKQLKEKYKGLRHEIKMMKKLMRELFIAKGVVSASDFKN